ncbi:MAG: DEAD/DEAH box helicase family protein [Pseudomonadota bacterium]
MKVFISQPGLGVFIASEFSASIFGYQMPSLQITASTSAISVQRGFISAEDTFTKSLVVPHEIAKKGMQVIPFFSARMDPFRAQADSILNAYPNWFHVSNWQEKLSESEHELFEEIKSLHEKSCKYFLKLLGSLDAGIEQSFYDSFYRVRDRLEKTSEELELVYRIKQHDYAADLLDRSRLLAQELSELGRDLVAWEHSTTWKVGLTEIPKERWPRRVRPEPSPAEPRLKPGQRIKALINKPIKGLPKSLSLRPHQIQILEAIRIDMARARKHDVDFEGTVISPTGSGKTRSMIATIAMADQEWGLGFESGNKVIITTHRKVIGRQNLKEVEELLGSYFREKYKRFLKVSHVGGGNKDYSGDVIIASIPTVGKDPEAMVRDLKTELGDVATVPLLLMDEIHHHEARTWQETKRALQKLNSEVYSLGFTATPSGQEPNPVIRLKPYELIRSGALPNLNLMRINTRIHLDGLRSTRKDFNQGDLSDAINLKERHRLIMRAFEANGVRQVRGGEEGMAPSLFFGVDLKHVMGMAEYYQEYFKSWALELKDRKIRILGAKGSNGNGLERMDLKEAKEVIAEAKEDKGSGLIAVVWGTMHNKVRDLIMKKFEAGEIEAVFNCDVLSEGFDGHFVRNLIGARPTLSAITKYQEAGRILRYGEEVDDRGVLQEEIKRVVIDVHDILSDGRYQHSYREAYGIPKVIASGELYDIRATESAKAPEASPPPPSDSNPEESPAPKEEQTLLPANWQRLLDELLGHLDKAYAGDIDQMARDVGMGGDELLSLLTEDTGEINRRLVRRLATLLYLDRQYFDGSYIQSLKESDGYEAIAVMELLKSGLEIYFEVEGKEPGPVEMNVDYGVEEGRIKFTPSALKTLYRNQLRDQALDHLALGLYHYFKMQEGSRWVRAIGESMDELRGHRLEWDPSLHGFRGLKSLDVLLPRPAKVGEEWVLTGAAILKDGKIYGSLGLFSSVPAGRESYHYPKIWLKWSGEGWEICRKEGSGADKVAEAMEKAGLARMRADLRLGGLNALSELADLPKDFLSKVHRDIGDAELKEGEEWVLTGAAILKDGKIYGSLGLFSSVPAGRESPSYPKVWLKWNGEGWEICRKQGKGADKVAEAMEKAGLARMRADLRLGEVSSLSDLETLPKDFLSNVHRDISATELRIGEEWVLTGAAILKDGKISGSLGLFSSVPAGREANHYPKIWLKWSGEGWEICRKEGSGADKVAEAIEKAGLARMRADVRLGEVSSLSDLETLPKDFLSKVHQDIGDAELRKGEEWVLTGARISKDGKIEGSLGLFSSVPAGRESPSYPKVWLKWNGEGWEICGKGGKGADKVAQALLHAGLAIES